MPGFEDSNQLRCGFSYPQAQLTNMTSCCSGPISVYDGCFHFCDAEDALSFNDCVGRNVFTEGGFGTLCNEAASSAAPSKFGGSWKLSGLLGVIVLARLFI